MPAKIRPLGVLKTYIDNQTEKEIQPGVTVREAMLALHMPPEVVALVLVNDEQQPKQYIIQENDVVKLIAVIGGG